MKKIGFILEMVFLVCVLGIFVSKNADWLSTDALDVFTGEIQKESPAKNIASETNEGKAEVEKAKEENALEAEIVEEPIVDPNSPAGKAVALGLAAPPEIDINSWEYILVNSESRIDENFAPEIGIAVSDSSESNQDKRIVESLNKFAAAAESYGLPVYLSSGYRSYETQQMLFEMKCEEYDYDTAATIVAIPGTSEHQTGLCCDITDVYRDHKNSELEDTETYKWMSAHCAEYGFIVRFPKGKEDITKIIYEPWHFRYVGTEAAKYIMENNLTLEEFVSLYK